jgi:lysophospholipase L1-like esterase
MGTIGTDTIAITSDGGADDVTLPAATVTTAGVATAAQITAISHTVGMVRDNANPLLGLDLHYTSITSHATATPASDDYMLVSDTNDSSILKKVTVSDIQAISGSITLSSDLDVNGYRIVNGSGDGMLIDTSDRLDIGGADYGTKLGGASPPPGDANFWGNFSNFRCVGGINIKGMYSDGRFGGIYIYDSDDSGNRATLVQMDSSLSTKRIILGQFSQNDADQIIYIGGKIAALGGATLTMRESGAVSGTLAVNSIELSGTDLSPLVDDSMADTLHRHSELSASDGIPDGKIKVAASGFVGIGTDAPDQQLDIVGRLKLTKGGTSPSAAVLAIGAYSDAVGRNMLSIHIDTDGVNTELLTVDDAGNLTTAGTVNGGSGPAGHSPVTLAATAIDEGLIITGQEISYATPRRIKIGIIGESSADSAPLGTWVEQFRRIAEQAGVQLVIANAAVGGSTSVVAYNGNGGATYQHGWNGSAHIKSQTDVIVAFDPDIVIIALGHNDTTVAGKYFTGALDTSYTNDSAKAALTRIINSFATEVEIVYLSAIAYNSSANDAVNGVAIADVASWQNKHISPYLMSEIAHLDLSADRCRIGGFKVGTELDNDFLDTVISAQAQYNYTKWVQLDAWLSAQCDDTIDVDFWRIARAGLTGDTVHPSELGNEFMAEYVVRWFARYARDNNLISSQQYTALGRQVYLDPTYPAAIDAMANTADVSATLRRSNHAGTDIFARRESWMYQYSNLEFYITSEVASGRSIVYRIRGAEPNATVYVGFDPANAVVYGVNASMLENQALHAMTTDSKGQFETSADAATLLATFGTGTYDAVIAVSTTSLSKEFPATATWAVYYQTVTLY